MSELKVSGVVKIILDQESGVSNAGKEWSKQDFVIETKGEYPKLICFTLFGEKTSLLSSVKVGNEVDVSFNVESREYNGKYFHNVNAWKITVTSATEANKEPKKDALPPSEMADSNDDESDLPF